jgi:16S rRNA (guanine(527)-N(7))-methyltransferase RsmG
VGVLERWLEELLATPGLTAIRDRETAYRVLVDDALKALPVVRESGGAIVDVGSGGGSPGLPLAARLPERKVTLLESQRRKCEFLRRVTAELPNVEVVWGRSEQQPPDTFGVALGKALALPPVAAELCLPLVAPGGIVVLWVGRTADPASVATVASQLGGELEREDDGLLVLRKIETTPAGFPRRPGMAKKRPLA